MRRFQLLEITFMPLMQHHHSLTELLLPELEMKPLLAGEGSHKPVPCRGRSCDQRAGGVHVLLSPLPPPVLAIVVKLHYVEPIAHQEAAIEHAVHGRFDYPSGRLL